MADVSLGTSISRAVQLCPEASDELAWRTGLPPYPQCPFRHESLLAPRSRTSRGPWRRLRSSLWQTPGLCGACGGERCLEHCQTPPEEYCEARCERHYIGWYASARLRWTWAVAGRKRVAWAVAAVLVLRRAGLPNELTGRVLRWADPALC
jgi:hypothetical protein